MSSLSLSFCPRQLVTWLDWRCHTEWTREVTKKCLLLFGEKLHPLLVSFSSRALLSLSLSLFFCLRFYLKNLYTCTLTHVTQFDVELEKVLATGRIFTNFIWFNHGEEREFTREPSLSQFTLISGHWEFFFFKQLSRQEEVDTAERTLLTQSLASLTLLIQLILKHLE